MLSQLPQRPRQHVLEDESIRFVKQRLPAEWIVESGQKDYGVDLVVEIVTNNRVTGAHFLMQLKATDRPSISNAGYIAYPFKTSTLQYFLQRLELVIVLIYDAKVGVGYWLWAQDFIRQIMEPNFHRRKKATIRIPTTSQLDDKGIAEIRRRVLDAHVQSTWLTAVQTAENPHVGYRLTFGERAIQIAAYEKYPGALKNHPAEITGTFKFDESPEAQEARNALVNSFRTGQMVRIDSKFFEGFDPTSLAPELFAHLGKVVVEQIEIGTATRDERVPAKLEILDQNHRPLAAISYIDLKLVQAGSEESTFSNEHQATPLKVKWIVNSIKQTSSFKFRIELIGADVSVVEEFAKFAHSGSSGKWFQFTNLGNGISIRELLPQGIAMPFDNAFVALMDDLVFIQRRTGQQIRLPSSISTAELQKVSEVAEILRTGSVTRQATQATFTLDKNAALRLAEAFRKTEKMNLTFQVSESAISFFGLNFLLGPRSMNLPGAKPTAGTLKALESLGAPSGNLLVEVVFDLDVNQPTVTDYPNWKGT